MLLEQPYATKKEAGLNDAHTAYFLKTCATGMIPLKKLSGVPPDSHDVVCPAS